MRIKRRFNLMVDEHVKVRAKQIAAEIDPQRPRIQDVLMVAIMIHDSDPRTWNYYVTRYLATRRVGP
ncbi:MAG: hypothetical protein QXP81_09335 [Nitrososphaerota archaeon]